MLNTIMERVASGKFVLIAEIGVNYYDIATENGITPMEAAKKMIYEASEAGIHAVKFQTYKADTLAAKDSPSYWDTSEEPETSQHELFKKFDSFGEREYKELSNYCNQIGIEFLSTPFDFESADYLNDLMNVYKISSSDLSNIPFIEYQAKKNKPIILSVGASNDEEIEKALETIRRYNNKPIILMHCVLEYPTPYNHANLNKICSLRERFSDVIIGYSDHTKPDEEYNVVSSAYLLGAKVIEKHYTLNKKLKGNDHYHAMDPDDARKIIKKISNIDEICGSGEIRCLESEKTARLNARRSIVINQNLSAGTILTEEMVTFKRPGTGISPSEMEKVLGKKIKEDISDDTILQYEMLES